MNTDETFDYDGPDALRQPIERALLRVVDPEMALSILDVGLIYRVALNDERVHVAMTMTSAACPVADAILDDVEAELGQAVPGREVDVELVWEPPWTPERMSVAGRLFMGW